MRLAFRIAFVWLLLIGCPSTSRACTTVVFSDGDSLLYARNLDWMWGDGIVVINSRGLSKTAFLNSTQEPAKWVSKYGSVTFNQFGREMPYGGMNEAGLVISQMMLLASEYPEPDDRPAVNILQWIQFQLDNARTIDEVIASDNTLRLERPLGKEKIHYLICDASGDVATFELLDGKLVCHRGETLPAKALTNNTYGESAGFASEHEEFGGSRPVPSGMESLHRFVRAARCSRQFESRSPEEDQEFCFDTLRDVAQGKFTVWSIVYDIPARKVYFRTRENRNLRWFTLHEFDFSPHARSVFLSINDRGQGPVANRFRELTEPLHKEYLLGFFGKPDVKQVFGDLVPMADRLTLLLRDYQPGSRAEDTAPLEPVLIGK